MCEVENGLGSTWQLDRIPTIGFYRALHNFMKKNFTASKTTIGKFYCSIDSRLDAKGCRPDNIHRFVDIIVRSNRISDQAMLYDAQPTCIRSMCSQLKKCTENLESLNSECTEIKQNFQQTRNELKTSKAALREMTSENTALKQKWRDARRRIQELKYTNATLRDDCASLQADLLSELDPDSTTDTDSEDDSAEPSLQSIIGSSRKYSLEIRKLYYTLLAAQVPVSKVSDIIRSVLKCLNPTASVEGLQLPSKTCATYMRKEELKSISDAHKPTVISQSKQLRMNTDGTTKHQKKLGGIVVNNLVLGVNELQDGCAISAVDDISRELEKLHEAATLLGLPNADSINWTLVVSSTSDSAATQKRVNKLIEEQRKADEERFGPATIETMDLVETFCAMHLGVNLRKAFLNGIDDEEEDSTRYHKVDTLVHEFCKLFGTTGVPEYCLGVVSFPDFLALKINSSDGEQQGYYQNCTKVHLHRQIGSRYFVTASNACRVIFLKDAAIEYLRFTGKGMAGNKLERDVFCKLQDPLELAHLKVDSLFYYHVYADLYMLAKSKDLGKSVLCMNQHYLELQLYLREVTKDPSVVFDSKYHVFSSENRLYEDGKVNHRLKGEVVYNKLFKGLKADQDSLEPLLVRGASKMELKLSAYAADQLPGGRYWDADSRTQDVLRELQPSNDVCESILGLNDYLTTQIPNLHQMTRSNLVQVKKNKTLHWLSQLPDGKQQAVIDMAVQRRRRVTQMYKDEEQMRKKHRQQAMIHDNAKREALKKKQRMEKEKLLEQHLITTPEELEQVLKQVDEEKITAAKKRTKKREVLKTQVQIRKKVLSQNVPITFTVNRRQRPLEDLAKELSDFIKETDLGLPPIIKEPMTLIGRSIKHKFLNDNEDHDSFTWYVGQVLDYCDQDKTHSIKYEGEDEVCSFDLTLDFVLGDIILI